MVLLQFRLSATVISPLPHSCLKATVRSANLTRLAGQFGTLLSFPQRLPGHRWGFLGKLLWALTVPCVPVTEAVPQG